LDLWLITFFKFPCSFLSISILFRIPVFLYRKDLETILSFETVLKLIAFLFLIMLFIVENTCFSASLYFCLASSIILDVLGFLLDIFLPFLSHIFTSCFRQPFKFLLSLISFKIFL